MGPRVVQTQYRLGTEGFAKRYMSAALLILGAASPRDGGIGYRAPLSIDKGECVHSLLRGYMESNGPNQSNKNEASEDSPQKVHMPANRNRLNKYEP